MHRVVKSLWYSIVAIFHSTIYTMKRKFTSNRHVCSIQVKECIFGPTFMKQYDFMFDHRLYSVLLDLNETYFEKFTQHMLFNKHKVAMIQNRAIQSSTIDVPKFNRFFGPFCDFYISLPGTHMPATIDFFAKTGQHHKQHRILDTMGVWHTYEPYTPLSLLLNDTQWCRQCSVKKTPVEKKHSECN